MKVAIRGVGAISILFLGLVHLYVFPEIYHAAAWWIWWAFLTTFVGASLATVGIVWRGRTWGWLLGGAVSTMTFIGYIFSRTTGIPGYFDGIGKWAYAPGIFSLVVEILFLISFVLAVAVKTAEVVSSSPDSNSHVSGVTASEIVNTVSRKEGRG